MIACGPSAGAEPLVTASYQLDTNQDVDKIGTETTNIQTLKQVFEIKYKGLLSPVVKNEVTFKVEQEINSADDDIIRFLPTLDIGFKGRYWEAKSGAKRIHENSDEPGKNAKITDSYFVEVFYNPRTKIPDLKFKYVIDTDSEAGATDTRKDGVTVSSVYQFSDWLDLKGDFTHDVNDDRLQPDSDTIEQKRSATIGIRKIFYGKIKLNSEYTLEEIRGGTMLDAGGLKDKKEDETHTIKNTLSFRPFRATSLDGSYDVTIKQNMVNGEHSIATTPKVTVNQKIGTPIDATVEFLRSVTEDRHTTDDKTKTEDSWAVSLKAQFAKQLDFNFKYQKKDTDEIHADPAKSITSGSVNKNATWTGELAPFWKASATYDVTDTFEREAKTTIDTKYSLKTTFDFKAINLLLEPTYDITLKEDFVIREDSTTKDFKFKIAYKVLTTRNIGVKIDHTYGRKTDSAANNIQRTDSSTGNVTWNDVLPGWMLGFDLTRAATDTSEDDLGPDITTTFGIKADYKFKSLAFNTNYKYDKKSLTDDAETLDLKLGWVAVQWDATLTYTFNKTFSVELNEGYSIAFAFKYLL